MVVTLNFYGNCTVNVQECACDDLVDLGEIDEMDAIEEENAKLLFESTTGEKYDESEEIEAENAKLLFESKTGENY